MHKVIGTHIIMTRGDTVPLQVGMKQGDNDYTPQAGDVVRFALKHAAMLPDRSDFVDSEPIITKIIPNETLILTIQPNDTKELPFGEYAYDVEITFSGGAVDTFIADARLTLAPEVH